VTDLAIYQFEAAQVVIWPENLTPDEAMQALVDAFNDASGW
jgi:hypothetical protein